jgi:hypothetical protein
MSKQQTLHRQASKHLATLEGIIDQLKDLGPCPLDGDNARQNIAERLAALARRAEPS